MLNCESRISNMKKLSEHHGTCDCVCVCLCRVPFLMVGGLLISGERTDTIDSAFFYGRAQVRKTPAVILYFILFFYSVPFLLCSSWIISSLSSAWVCLAPIQWRRSLLLLSSPWSLISILVFGIPDHQHSSGACSQPGAWCDFSDGSQPRWEGAERLPGPEQSCCCRNQWWAEGHWWPGGSATATAAATGGKFTCLQRPLRYKISESESIFLYCPRNWEICLLQQLKDRILQKKK